MIYSAMAHSSLKVLIDEKRLQQRIQELGQQISQDYKGRELHLICILKGACVFLADLIRHLPLDISIDFMAVSSYADNFHSSGEIKIIKDLECTIEGRDVLIIEDILDTGLTLDYLVRNLRARHPHSLRTVVLLTKPARRIIQIDIDYVGFEIPNEFAVGYGLDYDEKYRNLPHICVIDEAS
jgi:hypoxanthine phosphoribosyltransferase